MVTIYQNLKNKRQYSASTGLKKEQFETLLDTFKKYYVAKEQPFEGSITPVLTDAGEALFFILYYLKTGLTFQVLGMCFGISDYSACSYIKKLKPILLTCLKELKMMPLGLFSSEKEFDEVFKDVKEIVIDCTEITVPRAEDYDKQSDFYNGQKKNIS